MPRSLQEILDQGDELAQRFENYEPAEADRRPVEPLHRARAAVQAKATAEAELAAAVTEMRSSGYSWATIGGVLGTSGEAARQRYGDAVAPTTGRREPDPAILAALAKASGQKTKPVGTGKSSLRLRADAKKPAARLPTVAAAVSKPARKPAQTGKPAAAKAAKAATPTSARARSTKA